MTTIHADAVPTLNTENSSVPQKLAAWTAAVIAGCWLIYFVFAPTTGFDLLAWHNEQRVLQVALLLVTTLSYVWLSLSHRVVRPTPAIWLFFGFGAISTLLSHLPTYAAAELALSVQLVFLGAFSASLVRSYARQASFALLYSAWLIGAVYVVGVAANYVAVVVEQRPVDLDVFILGFSNPRFASALHALVLPLIAWIALDKSFKRSLRYSSWIIAALLSAISLALGTRAIWAAFFVTGIGFWWFGGQRGRQAVAAVSLTAASGFAVYLLAWAFVPSVLPQTGSMHSRLGGLLDSSARFDVWQLAAEVAYANPWFGIGPMHFATLRTPFAAHPHNWPLQVASEWGLPALLTIVFVIIRWMRAMRAVVASRVNEMSVDAFPAIALSAVTAVVYGLVDGNWVMPVSQSLAVVLVGASVGLLPGGEPAPTRRVNKSRAAALISVAVATGALLGWYTSRSVGSQLQNEQAYAKRIHAQYFLPRFWQQGIILDDHPK